MDGGDGGGDDGVPAWAAAVVRRTTNTHAILFHGHVVFYENEWEHGVKIRAT